MRERDSGSLKPSCLELEQKKVMYYTDKAHFFSVFQRILELQKIDVRVEPKCIQKNGNECYPDFVCKIDESISIFEHKGSVSNAFTYVVEEIKDTERYLELELECDVTEVILIVPDNEIEKIVDALNQIDTELAVWSFNLDKDKQLLVLNQCYGKTSKRLNNLLDNQFRFELYWFSSKRFLRDNPPVVYTASYIWNTTLRFFLDPWLPPSESFDVDLKEVIKKSKDSFPKDTDANQITSRRVKEALEFLNEIGWVNYPNEDGEVTVNKAKALREKMVAQALLKEYCKTKEGEQSSLDEFLE